MRTADLSTAAFQTDDLLDLEESRNLRYGPVFCTLSARDPRQAGGTRVNMLRIAQMRNCLKKRYDISSTLVIVNLYDSPLLGARNRVALRLSAPNGIAGEIEVAWLHRLLQTRRSTILDEILSKLRGCDSDRSVA